LQKLLIFQEAYFLILVQNFPHNDSRLFIFFIQVRENHNFLYYSLAVLCATCINKSLLLEIISQHSLYDKKKINLYLMLFYEMFLPGKKPITKQ
jgi:hypothetical protein